MRFRGAVERLSRAIDRHRRTIVVVVGLTEVLAAAAAVREPAAAPTFYVALLAAMGVLLVASLVIANVLNRRRTRSLDLAAAGFTTPRLGAGVLMASAFLALVAWLSAVVIVEVTAGRVPWGWLLGLLLVPVLLVSLARYAWIGPGVLFTPDGLVADRALGAVTVPWDAIDPDRPPQPEGDGFQIRLPLARPELVRRPRWVSSPDLVPIEGVDAAFVADAISFYVLFPERRPFIGTAAELDRLTADLDVPPDEIVRWAPAAPGSDLTRTGFVVRVVLLAGTFPLIASDALPEWLRFVVSWIGFLTAGSLGGHALEWLRKVLSDRREAS